MNDELTLPERMVYEAQNNQMIDSHFLEAGNLLNEGADEIERLRERVGELEKALRLLRDTVHEIAEWEELDGFAEAYDMCRALAEIIGGEDD